MIDNHPIIHKGSCCCDVKSISQWGRCDLSTSHSRHFLLEKLPLIAPTNAFIAVAVFLSHLLQRNLRHTQSLWSVEVRCRLAAASAPPSLPPPNLQMKSRSCCKYFICSLNTYEVRMMKLTKFPGRKPSV